MIGLLLTLACCSPQAADDVVVVVSGAVRHGRMSWQGLGLGDGGLVAGSGRRKKASVPGQATTSGGVVIRARAAGVKLDFPSGGELLVGHAGRVHLRDGAATDRNDRGLRLLLADGAVLTVVPTPGGKRPVRSVELRQASRTMVLWRGRHRYNRAISRRTFLGATYLVVGDGSVVYRPMQLGPVAVLERALCPRAAVATYPARKVVICGDVLGASLQLLSKTVPRHLSDFPAAGRIADGLAAMADRLFAPGTASRPSGSVGAVIIQLAGGYRLHLEVRGSGPLALALVPPQASLPVVEWTVDSSTTRLHLVQPDAGRNGRPRYSMRGVDLRSMVGRVFPFENCSRDVSRARRLIVEAGAIDRPGVARPALLPVAR